MESAVITSKNQFRLPDNILKRYGIKSGDKIIFVEEEDCVLLISVKKIYS